MKMKFLLASTLIVVAVIASGCGLAQSLMGTQGGTVSNLWSDVPPLPNATKADINLPPVTNIIIQGFIQAANADSNSDTKLDKFDFIAYNTADTPEQVSQFYSKQSMESAGWTAPDMPGCQGGASEGVSGSFCVFGKKEGEATTVLMILPVKDNSANPTQVFYVRFQGSPK